jgi:hypothetical protein
MIGMSASAFSQPKPAAKSITFFGLEEDEDEDGEDGEDLEVVGLEERGDALNDDEELKVVRMFKTKPSRAVTDVMRKEEGP